MKICIVILIPVLLYYSTPVYADGVFLEGGQGFHYSTDSQVIFLSYHIDSPPLFGLNSYYNAALGSWNGSNHNNAISLTKGLWMNLSGKSYISFEPGGAYLRSTTENLGTRLQFAFRSALGIRTEKYDLSVGYRHFSNGKGIFHWTDTANYGENFITFQIGYLFNSKD
ncbi:MAG: acyloxyacyl hydrolase [Desulfomonilia bacterium]